MLHILSDIVPNEGFTLQDLKDGVWGALPSDRTSAAVEVIRYGMSHIRYLLEKGYLFFDLCTEQYSVNRSVLERVKYLASIENKDLEEIEY